MKNQHTILLIFLCLIFLQACLKHPDYNCDKKSKCTEEFRNFSVDVVDKNDLPVLFTIVYLKDQSGKKIRHILPTENRKHSFAFSGDADKEILLKETKNFYLEIWSDSNLIHKTQVSLSKDCCHAIWNNAAQKIIIP